MSRANDDTQVDYSLLDDRALGDAVAEVVLGGMRPVQGQKPWCFLENGDRTWVHGHELVSWWGAGLVIDKMRAEGYTIDIGDWGDVVSATVWSGNSGPRLGDADHESPVRAVLIAALRAREAE